MSEQERCGHPREGDDPCGSAIGLCDDCGKCWAHCEHVPDEERQEARERGGKATAAKRRKFEGLDVPGPLESLEDAKLWLETIAAQVVANRMPPNTAHAAIRAVQGWVEANKDATAMEEFEELQEQLAELRRGEFETVAGDG